MQINSTEIHLADIKFSPLLYFEINVPNYQKQNNCFDIICQSRSYKSRSVCLDRTSAADLGLNGILC